MIKRLLSLSLACSLLLTLSARADESLSQKVDRLLEQWIADAQKLAADPGIVEAVKAQNAQLPEALVAMTQDKWADLPLTDPAHQIIRNNPASALLKAQRAAHVSEAFLSDAEGRKVAFLAPTTSWSHKGKAKHDVPMTGKVWKGKIELDKSAGTKQIQVAVPVLDGQKPIGSLGVGIELDAFTGN